MVKYTEDCPQCFVARWLGLPLSQGQLFTVDVGGVSAQSPKCKDLRIT